VGLFRILTPWISLLLASYYDGDTASQGHTQFDKACIRQMHVVTDCNGDQPDDEDAMTAGSRFLTALTDQLATASASEQCISNKKYASLFPHNNTTPPNNRGGGGGGGGNHTGLIAPADTKRKGKEPANTWQDNSSKQRFQQSHPLGSLADESAKRATETGYLKVYTKLQQALTNGTITMTMDGNTLLPLVLRLIDLNLIRAAFARDKNAGKYNNADLPCSLPLFLFHDQNTTGQNKFSAVNTPARWVTAAFQRNNPEAIGEGFALRDLLGITSSESNTPPYIKSARQSLTPAVQGLLNNIAGKLSKHHATSELNKMNNQGQGVSLPASSKQPRHN